MSVEYYQCECCEKNVFYIKRIPKTEIICCHCGFVLEIFPEGLRLLSYDDPAFFTKTFHKFSAIWLSVIIDGAI